MKKDLLKSLFFASLVLAVLILGFAGLSQADGQTATEPLDEGVTPYSSIGTNLGVSQAQSVLIALADDISDATLLQSELLAFGIPVVDIMNVRDYTPALAELLPYDAVITWSNNPYQNKVAMGDVLADYVDNGGRVVLGTFVWYGPSFDLAGRIQSPGYSPFEQAGESLYSTTCLGAYDPAHPLMAGVTAACDFYRDNVIVEPGATLVASWDDGYPFVGVNADCSVVGITSYPANNRQFTGDVARIYYNGVNCIGGPDLIVSSLAAGIRTYGTPMVRGVFANYMVTNQGSGDAVSSCLDFYLSRDSVLDPGDVYVGTENIPGLAAGNSYGSFKGFRLSSDKWQPASGTWRVIADADACGDNEESDETNNQTSTVAGITVK